MENFRLRKDAFMCMVDGHAVFLDLRTDRYLALPPRSANLLGQILGATESSVREGSPAASDSTINKEANELALQLESEGLLTKARGDNRDSPPVIASHVDNSALDSQREYPPLGWGDIANIGVARISSSVMMKVMPLRSVIERIRTRKAASAHHAHYGDTDEYRYLACMYQGLRPLVVRKNKPCLQDSLMLVEFLARRGLVPDWVFGVRLAPFAAHCWVQHGSTVLNDYVERVKVYTPIMVV